MTQTLAGETSVSQPNYHTTPDMLVQTELLLSSSPPDCLYVPYRCVTNHNLYTTFNYYVHSMHCIHSLYCTHPYTVLCTYVHCIVCIWYTVPYTHLYTSLCSNWAAVVEYFSMQTISESLCHIHMTSL